MLMRNRKQTTSVKPTSILSSNAHIIVGHKITRTVGAAAIVVAGSLIVSTHVTGTKIQTRQKTDLTVNSQIQPESTDKNSLAASSNIGVSSSNNANEDELQPSVTGHTHVNVTTNENVTAKVSVNNHDVPMDDDGGAHQTVPTTEDAGTVSLTVDAHSESGDSSKNKSNNTVRISSSSSTKTSNNSSGTTRIMGGQ